MSKKTKNRKIHKSKRTKRYYGLQVLTDSTKFAWVSVQNKHGWSLGLALNNRTVWLRNLRFKTKEGVQTAMRGYKVQYLPLKGTK